MEQGKTGRVREVVTKYSAIIDLFKKTGELVGFHPHVKQELEDAWRVEVNPYFHLNASCPACVEEFLKNIIRYDKQ